MKTISTTITNGVQTVFPVSFALGYIDKAHVFVYTGDVYTEQVGYTWVNETTIETSTVLPANTSLKIRRVIPKTQLINDYTNNAILEEQNLDDSFKQAMMWLEEIEDGFMSSDDMWVIRMSIQMLGNIDMNGYRVFNLPTPTAPTEPVRLQDIPDLVNQAQGSNYIGEEPPVSTFNGLRWYKPSEATTFVYYVDGDSGQWVQEPVVSAGSAMVTAGGARWESGTGSPEGVLSAPVGSLYTRTDGGVGATFYVKESGTGTTGWIAK